VPDEPHVVVEQVFATCAQLCSLASISKRKWMPPQTRLLPSSRASAQKLEYGSEWTTAGGAAPVYQVAENDFASVPKTLASICAAPEPMHDMLLACEAYGGVTSKGAQPGSATVAGLSSMSAAASAVSGRQSR
jgi:hypothetical protein